MGLTCFIFRFLRRPLAGLSGRFHRFFDVLSGTECAEIDGIAHDGLLHDNEHKTAYPVAGRGFRKVDN